MVDYSENTHYARYEVFLIPAIASIILLGFGELEFAGYMAMVIVMLGGFSYLVYWFLRRDSIKINSARKRVSSKVKSVVGEARR